MRVIIAPDSFKGTLTQIEVATYMKEAFSSVFPQAKVITKPMADGGEGTLDVIKRNVPNVKEVHTNVTGVLGEVIEAKYLIIDEDIALIEVANIIGLPSVKNVKENPLKRTTYGVGEVLLHALTLGIRKFYIALGGSATNDGGLGFLQALGVDLFDEQKEPLSIYNDALLYVHNASIEGLDKRLEDCTFTILRDVRNPLYGEHGAIFTFGPQKGIEEKDLPMLDRNMKKYANVMTKAFHRPQDIAKEAGTGAAGGLGFAFSLLGGKRVDGASFVAKQIRLEEAVKTATLVITGEGGSDQETVIGKAPGFVAKLAQKYKIPCILVSGTIEQERTLLQHFTKVYSLVDKTTTKEQAINQPVETLVNKIKSIAKEIIK